jgi:hypothetical protein
MKRISSRYVPDSNYSGFTFPQRGFGRKNMDAYLANSALHAPARHWSESKPEGFCSR